LRPFLDAVLGPVACEQDDAWARAEELLASSLTHEQHQTYLAKGYVEVASPAHDGRTYRIDGWRPVSVYEHGRFAGAVCIRPREYLPGPDVLLARKLLIEGAEDEFLRSGNWLQPAWRPAGAAPVVFLLLALLGPWMLHLRTLGAWGLAAIVGLLCVPAGIALRARASGSAGRRGTRTTDAG
jgi:hypothetical protein